MRYCKRCVQPDTRPGIYFDESDVCGACLYQESIATINWVARWEKLERICDWARSKHRDYDCVVGVSGGKDSTFQALTARDRLGLRVLLVNSEPGGITEAGRHNFENLKQMGFDTISLRPNPRLMQKMRRLDFFRYLNPVKISEYSLFASAYIVASNFNIPMVIQGENPGLTQGTRHTIGTGSNALNVWRMNTVSKNYLDEYARGGVDARDLFMFHYDPKELAEQDIQAVWLQYYLPEWSQPHNAEFSIRRGLHIRPELDPHALGTYRRFYQIDSDLVQVNQMLKWYKLGFGQCTDHANYDIRSGVITREEGIALVRAYDGECDTSFIAAFCEFVGISLGQFWDHIRNFVGSTRYTDPIWSQWPPAGDIYPDEIRYRLDEEVASWMSG